ncbi:crotonase/enoyl-CoA hydratase family protein [Steroidobacter sp.]|uniref:crotonase/enoyl-CoA hydratase family protein n=1 Tax=Steroidobacter sp. TaxID=1978227 RepID=UPI001A532C22|nr:crotonase/enoyl-CoA hydratase family protein [Steroidobacter sp.]MBL8270081.1 crotonase/enoyl-CoA hydratase family protein [Steroidobacter sp.]
MQLQTLKVQIDASVAWIWLNRPERANALNAEFWREFPQLLQWVEQQPQVKVAVLAGEGRNFCAGADIELLATLAEVGSAGECAATARENLRREILHLQDGFTAIERLRVPLIAAIHGACVGAGVDLIAACDLRYSSADAKFSIKEIDYAIVPDVGTLQRLRHVIGLPTLTELAYTAETFQADKARQIGLVGAVHESREVLYDKVRELANVIASKSAVTVRGIKHNLLYSRDHDVAEGLEHVATWNASMLLSDDLRQALSSARRRS